MRPSTVFMRRRFLTLFLIAPCSEKPRSTQAVFIGTTMHTSTNFKICGSTSLWESSNSRQTLSNVEWRSWPAVHNTCFIILNSLPNPSRYALRATLSTGISSKRRFANLRQCQDVILWFSNWDNWRLLMYQPPLAG